MTEEVPSASGMPECNGSVTLKKGPLQVVGEIAKSVGMVPCTNAEMRPDDAPPAEENRGENRNSLAEDIVHGDFDEEKQCKGPGSEGLPAGSREPVMGMAASTVVEAAETLAASTDGRGNATEEEEEEVEEEEDDDEEEDTEEDDVQVIEIKKENSKASHLKQYDSGKEASPLTTPGCNSPVEKPGEQLSLGKKNDISRHSYSRYNTISYRRIRKGNTKQRIDEFESMMHL
ncbi:ermin isoform X2 [Pezoporus wallicus]|uniref:ermin isoform X2 n=1 Tax=Pezoporus wallicus TaxID=35540 RepID=UPI00254C1A43|nr:ermin isoform X2 [Pezoporus wallicus]